MQLSDQSFVPLPSKEPWSLTIVSSLLLGNSQKRCVFHCLPMQTVGGKRALQYLSTLQCDTYIILM